MCEMANASDSLVRIAVRMPSLLNLPSYERMKELRIKNRAELIEWANKGMGVKGNREGTLAEGSQAFDIWVWERLTAKPSLWAYRQ